MKKIRIESDGTPAGTCVYDADGKKIEGCITAVAWNISADNAAEAVITFACVDVQVVGKCDG